MDQINNGQNGNQSVPRANTSNDFSKNFSKYASNETKYLIKPKLQNSGLRKQVSECSEKSMNVSSLNNKVYSSLLRQKIERGDFMKKVKSNDVFESASSLPDNDIEDSNQLEASQKRHTLQISLSYESESSNSSLPSLSSIYKLYLNSLNDAGKDGFIGNFIARVETQKAPLLQPSISKNKSKSEGHSLIADCTASRYEIVKTSLKILGFKVQEDSKADSFLVWSDVPVSTDCISELKPHQRVNHFPGMLEICRKDYLTRNMARMSRAFPNLYNFTPRTWILPNENLLCQNYLKDLKLKKKEKYLIIKPVNGAMGIGISLCRNIEKINPSSAYIVQEYIERPLLVDAYKCDLRIYVLLTSCDPLHVFVFNDGLLRMGTEKYMPPLDSNLECMYMHLTNYSVNKKNENYVRGKTDLQGSKRSLAFLKTYLESQETPWSRIWLDICDLIIKTVLMVHPYVYHSYRMCRVGQPASAHSVCFEILGFDILLDRKFKPWLLEVNRSPSFATDEAVDHNIKSLLIMSTVKLLNLKLKNKQQTVAQEKFLTQQRLMKSAKKIPHEVSEEVKNKLLTIERRKEELYNLLQRIKKDEERDLFERRNSGQYQRIFPTDDKMLMQKYVNIMKEAHRIYMSGQHSSLHQEIINFYTNVLKDYEVEELIEQCIAEQEDIERHLELNRKAKEKMNNIPTNAKVVTSKNK